MEDAGLAAGDDFTARQEGREGPLPARRQVVLGWVFILAGFAGVVPPAYDEARSLARRGRRSGPDRRYSSLRQKLPDVAPLGFVSDVSGPKRLERRLKAQYALAPHLVDEDDGTRGYLVADFEDPRKLTAFCRAKALRVLTSDATGVALLERGGPQ